MITDILDDIKSSRNKEEQIISAVHLLNFLPEEGAHEFYGKIEDFEIVKISENLIRASYLLEEKTRKTRRTSIWKKENIWKMVFHQGTVIL